MKTKKKIVYVGKSDRNILLVTDEENNVQGVNYMQGKESIPEEADPQLTEFVKRCADMVVGDDVIEQLDNCIWLHFFARNPQKHMPEVKTPLTDRLQLPEKIETLEEVKKHLDYLHEMGMNYHPDDSCWDLNEDGTNWGVFRDILTEEQCKHLDKLMDDCFEAARGAADFDIYGYVFDQIS